MIIKIYEDSISSKVIKTFNSKKDFYKWNEEEDVFADQVEINGELMLGFDEIDKIK
tara:strand:- start:2179 stop:2346 length:168 start_codon:yes stop_codon:yes gene_type:complete